MRLLYLSGFQSKTWLWNKLYPYVDSLWSSGSKEACIVVIFLESKILFQNPNLILGSTGGTVLLQSETSRFIRMIQIKQNFPAASAALENPGTLRTPNLILHGKSVIFQGLEPKLSCHRGGKKSLLGASKSPF